MLKMKINEGEQYLLIEALETTAQVYEDMKRYKRAERYYNLAKKLEDMEVANNEPSKFDMEKFLNELE